MTIKTENFNQVEKQDSMDVLNYQIRACEHCGLAKTRKHALIGEGNIDASLMFVALSPGTKENEQNRMFVGPAGQVFNRLLNAAGIQREAVFMTNLIKCMLPKNRKPTREEIQACNSFIEEEISIVHPEIVVPLGFYATRQLLAQYQNGLLASQSNFSSVNGQLIVLNGLKIFPISHPAALLYNPSFEKECAGQYQKLKSYL